MSYLPQFQKKHIISLKEAIFNGEIYVTGIECDSVCFDECTNGMLLYTNNGVRGFIPLHNVLGTHTNALFAANAVAQN